MDEFLLNIKDVVDEHLIVGDHDSLLIFGSGAQAKLRDFSKTISGMLMRSNDELEISINDVLINIEKFQYSSSRGVLKFIQSSQRHRKTTIRGYNELLVYIDKMTVCLQIQQAQLIKDAKVLERMSDLLDECIQMLEHCIQDGDIVLGQTKEKLSGVKDASKRQDLDTWCLRLERRLDALRISHAVSLQSIAQLDLMKKNNMQIVDRIIAAVSGTIPVWRNQVTLLLGLEEVNRDMVVQNRVTEITNAHIMKNAKALSKIYGTESQIDLDKVSQTNEKLTIALNELLQIEKTDDAIRLEFGQSLG